MNHSQKRKMIDSFYQRLIYDVTRPHAHGRTTMSAENPFGDYLDTIEKEERQHRRMGTRFGQTYGRKLPVHVAVRLFAVRDILKFRCGDAEEPRAKDFSHLKKSIFLAWQIWDGWKKEIRREFKPAESRLFLDSLDYAVMIEGR